MSSTFGTTTSFIENSSVMTQLFIGVETFTFSTMQVMKDQALDAKWAEAKDHFETLKMGVDETGKIMIIMYHRIGQNNSYYTRTIDAFKSDLQRLYDLGYRTVAYSDYIQGTFDIPKGTTPVVLTFDDGDISNFRYLETETELMIDPDSAVGILEAFSSQHPDFGTNAIFFLNKDNPFGQAKYLDDKMAYLYEHGYEIGNHTLHHDSLKGQSLEDIQKGVGANVAFYSDAYPNFIMDNIALPFGERPSDPDLYQGIFESDYNGYEYHNHSALLVGWRPEWPIYAIENYTGFLNRVQCGDEKFQLTYWLDYLEDHPQERFISDGKADIVTIPLSKLDQYYGDRDRLETYTLEIMGGDQ